MDKYLWMNPKENKDTDQAQIPLWFWNDRLTNEELVQQLELKSRTGILCTIPHARLNGGEGYIGGYLDEDWFEKIHTVLSYKHEHAETCWLYDEMDWPAGTCNKTLTLDEKNREQYLYFETIPLSYGRRFKCQLRKLGTADSKDIYNVKAVDSLSGKDISLKKCIKEDEFSATLDFLAEQDCVLYLMTIRVDPYDDFGDRCANYIDGNVTRRFIESTYDKYDENCKDFFGKEICAVFNDETRMANAYPWKDHFDEDFYKRKGYHILPFLFDLILPGEAAGRHRIDYFSVVADLFQDNFFGILKKWCNDRNLKFFAHLLGEETLASQVRYSGDFCRQARNLDIVGADHLGKGIGSLNAKFAACAAHSYGKDDTALEIFAGCGWDLSFEEYKRMIFWAFQQGMKRIINHGFFYSTRGDRKNDWPPSQFFQWKHWDQASPGNDIIRRLHMALSGGVSECDCLIYYPVESFMFDYIGNQYYKHGYLRGPLVENEDARKLDLNLQDLFTGLQNANIDFELLHEDALEGFMQKNGRLVNTRNGQSFGCAVIAWAKLMSFKALKMFCDFAENGGRLIVCGKEPALCLDQRNQKHYKQKLRTLHGHENVLFLSNKKDLIPVIQKNIVPCVKLLTKTKNTADCRYANGLIDPYIHTGETITGVRFINYIKSGKRHTYAVNYDDRNICLQFAFEHSPNDEIEIFEVTSGISYGILPEEGVIEFDLPENEAVIMVSKL